jgi:hypothetical protein
MKSIFLLFLSCCAVFAHGVSQLGASPSPITAANQNDERVKVFADLEAKAKAGDTAAMEELGRYYNEGRFPVAQDKEKAKALWTKGASLGSPSCARCMRTAIASPSTDSQAVIEMTKWSIITSVLSSRERGVEDYSGPTQWSGVSESSFKEAKARADAFLAGFRASKAAVKLPSGVSLGSSAGNRGSSAQAEPTELAFDSLSAFDQYRKKVCSSYLGAAAPIYIKGQNATDSEKAAFISAALEVERLQTYVGRPRRIGSPAGMRGNSLILNTQKINEYYEKMDAAKIETTLPAALDNFNGGLSFINALGQLMKLTVALNPPAK